MSVSTLQETKIIRNIFKTTNSSKNGKTDDKICLQQNWLNNLNYKF